jgi:O-antigen/teichoic acid export membrane protein
MMRWQSTSKWRILSTTWPSGEMESGMHEPSESVLLEGLVDRLLSGGAWAFVGRAGSILATAAVTFVLARLLNAQDLGTYFLGLSVAALGTTAGKLGLDQAAVKLIASATAGDAPGQIRRIISVVFGVGSLGALLVAIALVDGPGKLIAARVMRSNRLLHIMVFVGLFAGATVFERLVAESFRGFNAIREAVLFGGFLRNWTLFVIYLGALLFLPELSLGGVLTVALVTILGFTAIGTLRLVSALPLSKPQAERVELAEIMRLAWPLYVTTVAYVLLNNLDLWVVGSLAGEDAVAAYGVAVKLMLFVSFPILVVNAVVPPVISGLSTQRHLGRLEEVLRSSATLAGIPALLVGGMLIIAGSPIVKIAFGSEYANTVTVVVLDLLVLGQLISVWAGSCGLTLMMAGHHTRMMAITLMSAAFTLGAAFALGSFIGPIGVALGAALGQIGQNLIMWITVRRVLGIWTHFSPGRIPELSTWAWAKFREKV